MSRNLIFAACACAAVLLGLVLGFYRTGSPGMQRYAYADQARLQDLNAIASILNTHRGVFHDLPQSLADLHSSGSPLRMIDPETKAPYEYHRLDDRRFELCAVFATANVSEPRQFQSERLHGVGRQCFTFPE